MRESSPVQLGTDVPGLWQNPLNLPAVATANDLGLDTVFEYGKNSGLNMDKVDKSLAVALGSRCDNQSNADGTSLWNLCQRRGHE